MILQEIPIELLKPYWRNPRRNAKAVESVMASIERYGFQVPILVDKDMVIIAGHARYSALVKLGRPSAWVKVVELDPKKAAALRIADNKTHEWSLWDPAKLEQEVQALEDLAALRQHFKGEEWQEILGADPGATSEPEPDPTPPTSSKYTHKNPICPYCGEIQ